MRVVETEASPGPKFAGIAKATIAGILTPVEISKHAIKPEPKEVAWQSFQEDCLKILQLIEKNYPEVIPLSHSFTLPWTNRKISKARFLQVIIAFSDHASCPPRKEFFPGKLCRALIEQIIEKAETQGPVTIEDQFKLSMELASNRAPAALILLHGASRAIARNLDTQCDPENLTFEPWEMERWTRAITNPQETSLEDPAGNTYHFWGATAAGILSNTKIEPKDTVLNPAYNFIYANTARATQVLRYNLAGHPGTTHQEADQLGFDLGEKIAEKFKV